MKVILLQDVAKVGRRFEAVDVPKGHALNFLIPRKLAEAATKESLKRLQSAREKAEKEHAAADAALAETLAKLADAKVVISVPANEQGHLFKGLNAADIAAAVSKEAGMLPAEKIVLKAPIKDVGQHTITVAMGDREETFMIEVAAE